MPTTIEVTKIAPGKFRVRISESGGETMHVVSLKAADFQRLTGGRIPEEDLVEQSFHFLLGHEPKESILREFDLSVISRYFPQYEAAIKDRLSSRPSAE